MPRKYYVYDLTTTPAKNLHILFLRAVRNNGRVTFWKDSDGSEYCACWDGKKQCMHSDLYLTEHKELIVNEVNAKE